MSARSPRRGLAGPANGASRAAPTRIGATALVAALTLAGCGAADPPRALDVRVTDGVLSSREATAWPVGDSRVITVAHVLSNGQPVFVGGRRARAVVVDRRDDVAVLLVPGLRGATPRRAAARAGERARIVTPGHTIPAKVTRVITAHIDGTTRPALELAANVEPGDSGAPVIDRDGRVIGVLFAQASDRPAVAYATVVLNCTPCA